MQHHNQTTSQQGTIMKILNHFNCRKYLSFKQRFKKTQTKLQATYPTIWIKYFKKKVILII